MMMFMPCLGIVFQRIADKKVTGHKLFQSFIQENKACFWNMDLVEAANFMKYVGFIKPATLFVASVDKRYMQVLRDAWVRRILKPAKGFRIDMLGDVKGIEIFRINQIHLVPLPDIICNVVSKMNQSGRPATLDAVQDEIRKECPIAEPPSMRLLRQAIQNLLKQKILEYDLKQLHICLPQTVPYHTVSAPSKCTVECQTGDSVVNGCEPSNSLKTKKGFLARLFMKKGSPMKNVQIGLSRNPALQSQPQQVPVASAESNYDDETTPTAQKICLPHGYEFYRTRRRTGDLYIPNDFTAAGSSGCTVCRNYGPVDPPENLPCFTDFTDIDDEVSRKRRRRRKQIDERGRTSAPVQRGSDSAFSLSPVITEISNGCSSSRSGNGLPDEPSMVERNHTYVNMLSNESTQFEDITQVERLLPATLSITNV